MSADEIDAELLAMAGDSSDDEGDDYPQNDAGGDHSSDEEHEPRGRAAEPPTRTKGVAQKVKARGRRKRRQDDSDIDDNDSLGDRSPSAPLSPEPGLLEESDAGGEFDDEAPLFPLEGKFENARDREAIMAMNEIEREELLAERAAQVLRRQQDLQLKKALADSRATANKQKRKAAADLEESGRRTTRPKTDKRSALDDYRRAREQKGANRGRVDSRRDADRDGSMSPRSERDADVESEVEWEDTADTARRDEPPAELRDFDRCRVGRSAFAKVCFYPGFEEAIKGCFCRVNIGPNRETGQPQYRMTQIRGFTEGKPYQLEGSNGKRFTTDQYAIVAQGTDEKPFPFSACSDGQITEPELRRFAESLEKDNLRLPTRKFLVSKLEKIHALLNTNFTEETLQLKFNKQRAMQLKFDPVHIARTKRAEIERRRAEAEESGDVEEVERCDAELAALQNGAAASNGIKPKSSPITTNSVNLDRLAKLNHKNRGKTAQEVRQALIEERRKLNREREEAAKKKIAEQQAAAAAAAAAQTVALKKVDSENGTPKRSGTPSGGHHHASLGALKRKNLDDDIIGNLDLGIDLEI